MARVARNPEVLWREEEEPREEATAGLEAGEDVEDVGTSILFHNGRILSLNLLGTEIWKLCDGRTREELAEALAESFEVTREVVDADLDAFLAELKAQDFIRYED